MYSELPLDGAGEPATISRQTLPDVVASSPVVPESVSACDNCGKPLVLGQAVHVTNASEHLHAHPKSTDFPDCVEKLEQRLGTFVG